MNSKIRKGIAINSILLMTGGLLFAGLVGTLYTESPIASAMLQGTDLVKDNVDYTVDVTSDDDLSDLAMFTYQRASRLGCSENEKNLLDFEGGTVYKQNNELIDNWKYGETDQKGYPGLQESYLGEYPDCYGAGETSFKGSEGLNPSESGNDMEGIYSREKFEIKEPVVLYAGKKSREGVDTWLERNFLVASKDSFEQKAAPCNTAALEYSGTASQFAMYFEPNPSDDRALPWMSDPDNRDSGGIGDTKPYCPASGSRSYNIQPFSWEGSQNRDVKVVLCPEDKGYVQMNKWTLGQDPTNDGEANVIAKEAKKAGFIQITELGEDCGTAVPQIPEDENSVGNIFRIEANVNKGWGSVSAADLHRTGDEGKKFHTVSPYTFDPLEQDQCALYLRDKDGVVGDDKTGKDDNGAVWYRQGTLIGHTSSDTFPDLDSQAVEYSDLEEGNFNTGVTSEKDTRHMYGDQDKGLENVGFTEEAISSNLPFLTSKDSQTVFQPYGDMLCTTAETDDDESRSSNARWVVCDESNYNSPTTVDVEHYNGEREYRCSPGSGDWEVE